MKRIVLAAAFAGLIALPVVAQTPASTPAQAPAAQAAPATPPAQPLRATLKSMWDGLKLNLVQSAEKMPEADSHDNEHYGNVVTYMRLKGLVPPSTERAQQMRR
jgi:hypothetical protein